MHSVQKERRSFLVYFFRTVMRGLCQFHHQEPVSQSAGKFNISINTMALTLLSVALIGGSVQAEATKRLVQNLYYGGDIITMEGGEPTYVEAVIERDGTIIYVGPKASAVNNFAGKTMMPGFIEPHAHPVSICAFILANDIVAPHEWRMKSAPLRWENRRPLPLLEKNPFKIDPVKIKDIPVAGIVYKGKMKLRA